MAAPSTASLTFSKLRGAFAACGLAWASLQSYIIHGFDFDWFTGISDGLVSTVLLAAACWLINNNLRYYQPGKGSYINILIWCVALAAACTAGSRYILVPFLNTIPGYPSFMAQSLVIRFFTNFLAIGWMAMISMIWYTQQDQKENEKRKTEAERLAREAELYNLRQQLQPHFLFNSLNSINALIGFKPEQARKMIHQLSDFLRGTLRKDDQQQVTLNEELQHLNLYLDIEKIKFGLYDTTEEVVVSIRAELDGNYLELIVQNPFDPKTSRPRQGTGFGLSGVQRRLYLLFARNDLMETHANDNIFTTIIKIPQL